MWLDAQSLDDFYQTPIGKEVQRTLLNSCQTLWPADDKQDETRLMGLGYAVPYLDKLNLSKAPLAFLPPRLGHVAWPAKALDPGTPSANKNRINLSVQIQTDALPLADQAIDKALVIHCLEFSRHVTELCQELYRVLHDQGELIAVVPNRAGLWSRSERSPFGYGSPFTPGQITALLQANGFEVHKIHGALYFPPRRHKLIMRNAAMLERIGGNWAKLVAGALIVRARKQNPPISFSRKKQDAMAPIKDLLAGIKTGPVPGILQPAPISEKHGRPKR